MSRYLPSLRGWIALILALFASVFLPNIFPAKGPPGYLASVSTEVWTVAAVIAIACLGASGFAAVREKAADRVAAAIAVGLLVIFAVNLMPDKSRKRPPLGADATVVKVLESSLPDHEAQRKRFLWDKFVNQPEERKFNYNKTDKWRDNYSKFAQSLIRQAQIQKLDSASLRNALDLVLQDAKERLAYLPVGAYQTTLNKQPIWIITVKWEYSPAGDNTELSHTRVFAFDQKTLEQVGFVTCK